MFKSKTGLVIMSILLVSVSAVSIVMFLTRGTTTVTSRYGDDEVRENLVCESHVTSYPLFSYDGSEKKTLKVNAIFRSDKLASISLIYKLNYSSKTEIDKSESFNHAALNILSQGEGLGPDAFGAKYSKLDDGLQLSLFASDDEISSNALKYFMLNDLTSPYTREKVMKIYASKGLNCEVKK